MAGRNLFYRRVFAYVVDCAILFMVLGPLGFGVQYLLGITPETVSGVYAALLLNFSVPAWLYFAWGDFSVRGATIGKRLLSIQTKTTAGERAGGGRAFGRTAVKMIPWEITHASMFLFVPTIGEIGAVNWIGLGLAYTLMFIYLILAWRSAGSRSLHDMIAGTGVREMAG